MKEIIEAIRDMQIEICKLQRKYEEQLNVVLTLEDTIRKLNKELEETTK